MDPLSSPPPDAAAPPSVPRGGASVPRRPPPPRPALPGHPARDPELSVLVVREPRDLEPFVEDWDALAANALEPNPFYESWMLLPAMRAFGHGKRFEVVLVFGYDAHPHVNRRVLCGLFPLERLPRYGRLPVANWVLWSHRYAFFCAPLVRRGRAAECLDAFFDALHGDRTAPPMLKFGLAPGEGPFHAELLDALNRRGAVSCALNRANRAFLRPAADPEAYFEQALTGKRRKEYRRLQTRLAEAGRLEMVELQPDGDVGAWIEEFLSLEASGWKGREGTAFLCREADREYLRSVAAAAFRRGLLMMLAMRLDGKPVASKMNFLAGDGSFAFKIAFDEAYARFSPGVLLELENVRRVHARPALRWMDSCAVPDHFMANRLWTERRAVEDVFVATGRPLGGLLVSSIPFAQCLKGFIRRGTKADGVE